MDAASMRPNRLIYATAVLCVLLLGTAGARGVPHLRAERVLPFAPGERLRYVLKWTVVPAGEAVLEVLPMTQINGQPSFHFRLTAQSNAFVDLFYKVRDRIDAFADADMTHTVHYRQDQLEGPHRRDVRVDFDWQKARAHYSNNQKPHSPIRIQPGTFDPLSVFYYSRTLQYKENDLIVAPVTDGRKCIQGKARIIKRETVRLDSGSYDTYLIEPDLAHVGGVFEKDKNAVIKLWVTADQRRIPVKIASKVAVGSFVGELVAIEKGD